MFNEKRKIEKVTNEIGEKKIIGRLRGIFMCLCACSHDKRATVGMNLTQIKIKTKSV